MDLPRAAMRVLVIAMLAACGPTANPAACTELAAGDLVISEVLADPTGADTGQEWFELYVAADHPLDLAGAEVVHARPDGSDAHAHHISALAVAPGQYVTLGDGDPAHLPPWLDYSYGADLGALYNSGGGHLALRCGDVVIDAADYDDVEQGHARELGASPPDAHANDDPASWCRASTTAYEAGDFGTPGEPSDCRPLPPGECLDGDAARPIRAPAPGALVISELMPNPAVEPAEEWFEVTNTGADPLDLNELALDRAGDARPPDAIHATACLPLAPGELAVFARSADPATNGMLPAVAATFSFAMPNSGGDVRVLAADGTTVLATATWTSSKNAVSMQLVPDACPGVTPYGDGANAGTPGAPNRCM